MTSNKGWLADWEEETEERRPAPPVEAEGAGPYVAGTTENPAETARLRYRKLSPAECSHPPDARGGNLCKACGLVFP